MSIEGRITREDFEALLSLIGRVRMSERERCAQLHEQVNPASDDERLAHVPGAGAMGAVIQYRDMIRAAGIMEEKTETALSEKEE
jgi:hypothetical protein